MQVGPTWKSQDLTRTSTKKLSMILMSLQKSNYPPTSVSCNYSCTMTFLNSLYRSTMDSQQCHTAAPATHIPNASQEISLSIAISFADALKNSYLEINSKIHVHNSAVATFHAPSDISRVYGMCCKHIQAISSWQGGPAQYNCVLVNSDPDLEGTHGFEVAHVFLFFFISASKLVL